MQDMPRPRPPYLHKQYSRKGEVFWYVRRDRGLRIRIKEKFGTPAFDDAYQAAILGEKPIRRGPMVGTLAWLVDRYRDSSAWSNLAPATRKQRENILRKVNETGGAEDFSKINRRSIVAGRESRKATPAMARHFVETMRGLFRWALDSDYIITDPTMGVKAPKPRTDGHPIWTDEECARFEARWPVGTRERLAFDLLTYTGLRRGDVVRLGRQHVRSGVATLKTEKTGEVVVIPILPPLALSIDASPTGDLAFIAGERGGPMTKESFGNWFREVCDAAGVRGAAHGLRKAGATRAANNGATVAQLEALFGWRGGGMASLYTRKADRERLARDAVEKLMPNVYSLQGAKPGGAEQKKQENSNG